MRSHNRRFRVPRIWSNEELRKFAHLFSGDIVNVSAWKDEDKEGDRYRNYFVNANTYTVTNYVSEARGFQGSPGEIFLDLTLQLPVSLSSAFDVVFNHTTLEHIFEVEVGFSNLCKMSKDVVILVVPFLQEMHGVYGDFWRFTPLVIKRLFEKNGLELLYLSFNDNYRSSVYIFAIASKCKSKWHKKIPNEIMSGLEPSRIIGRPALESLSWLGVSFLKSLRRLFLG